MNRFPQNSMYQGSDHCNYQFSLIFNTSNEVFGDLVKDYCSVKKMYIISSNCDFDSADFFPRKQLPPLHNLIN